MEQKLVDAIEQQRNNIDGGKRLYLDSCIRELKMYMHTDMKAFTSLVVQIGFTFTDEDRSIQNAILEYFNPDTSIVHKDPVIQVMEEAPRISEVIGDFVYHHRLDTFLAKVFCDSLVRASQRTDAKKDVTLLVGAILVGMRKMRIPGKDAKDILTGVIAQLVDVNHKVDMYTLNMCLLV